MASLLARFADQIASASPADFVNDITLAGRLVIAREGSFVASYAPFDHVNTAARVVIVGITPGKQQAMAALLEAHRYLKAGRPLEEVAKAAKETASFAGPMRPNLIAMLDHVGLNRWLGVPSCSALFEGRRDLVHYTSALRYPVYRNGDNYAGDAGIVTRPMMRAIVEDALGEEVRALPDAVWIPLGPHPTTALRHLVNQGLLPPAKLLDGLPHPSGANAERIAAFLGRKAHADLSVKTNGPALEAAKGILIERVKNLQPAG